MWHERNDDRIMALNGVRLARMSWWLKAKSLILISVIAYTVIGIERKHFLTIAC
jgi:hypothetical protein